MKTWTEYLLGKTIARWLALGFLSVASLSQTDAAIISLSHGNSRLDIDDQTYRVLNWVVDGTDHLVEARIFQHEWLDVERAIAWTSVTKVSANEAKFVRRITSTVSGWRDYEGESWTLKLIGGASGSEDSKVEYVFQFQYGLRDTVSLPRGHYYFLYADFDVGGQSSNTYIGQSPTSQSLMRVTSGGRTLDFTCSLVWGLGFQNYADLYHAAPAPQLLNLLTNNVSEANGALLSSSTTTGFTGNVTMAFQRQITRSFQVSPRYHQVNGAWQLTTPTPEIVVEQPSGTGLMDGSSSINFGSVATGSTGAARTFVIRNTGDGNLTGIGVSLAGANTGDFLVNTSGMATSLSPGGSTTFSVSFRPGAASARAAEIRIASNDADENPFNIAISGTGVAVPEIDVWARSSSLQDGNIIVELDTTAVGQSSNAETFYVHNTGGAPLTGVGVSLTGAGASSFVVDTSNLPNSIAPGGNGSFTLRFVPQATGYHFAELLISSNDADENPFNISLGANAVTPSPEIDLESVPGGALASGGSLAFGQVAVQGSAEKILRIRNSGTATLENIAASITGGSGFALFANPPTTLAPGASVELTVRFSPTSAGNATATLSIASNDANENPYTVTLNGIGMVWPEIQIENVSGGVHGEAWTALDFGEVMTGKESKIETLRVRNLGLAQLNIASIGVTGGGSPQEFFASGMLAPTAIPAGGEASLIVQFTPLSDGNRTASLVVQSNDVDEGQITIPLRGRGVRVADIMINLPGGGNGTSGPELSSGEGIYAAPSALVSSAIGTHLSFYLRSVGNVDLTNLSLSLEGEHAADFSLPVSFPTTNSGSPIELRIGFHPSAEGLRRAILKIASNDPDENPFVIELEGVGATPVEVRKSAFIKAPESIAYSEFAQTVVVSGNRMAVFSRVLGSSDINQAGAIFIYDKVNGQWTLSSSQVPPTSPPGQSFSGFMALSGDFFAAVVNQPVPGNDGESSQSLLIYRKANNQWILQQTIKPVDGNPLSRFGATALRGDLLVVSEKQASTDASMVSVYRLLQGKWVREAGLVPTVPGLNQAWGVTSLDVSSDRVAIGTARASAEANNSGNFPIIDDAGAAFVFSKTNGSWQMEAYLKADKLAELSFFDSRDNRRFGQSVSLDGNTLAVGTPGDHIGAKGINPSRTRWESTALMSGAVYLFERTGSSWNQTNFIKPSNTHWDARFGTHVTVSGDLLLVGARGDRVAVTGLNGNRSATPSSSNYGAAFIFKREAGTWIEHRYLKPEVLSANSGYGSLVYDAGNLIVAEQGNDSGANGLNGLENDSSKPDSGALLAYELPEFLAAPKLALRLDGSFLSFGSQLALGQLLVGASTRQTFELLNIGDAPSGPIALFLDAETTAGFSLSANSTSELAPGGVFPLHLNFSPKAVGEFSTTLRIATSSGLEELLFEVTGTGRVLPVGERWEAFAVGETLAASVPEGVSEFGRVESIKGLPKGLKFNAKSGMLVGRPTTPGQFTLLMTIVDSAGNRVRVPLTVEVGAFPTWATGQLVASVAPPRPATTTPLGLGAMVRLAVSKTGAYTGTLTLARGAYRFRGMLEGSIEASFNDAPVILQQTIPLKGSADPIVLKLEIGPDGPEGEVRLGSETGQITSGWQSAWSSKYRPLWLPAKQTVSLVSGSDLTARNVGLLNLSALKTGFLAWAGVVMDGQKVKGSLPVSGDGQAAVHNFLLKYPERGVSSIGLLVETGTDGKAEVSEDGETPGRMVRPPGSNPGFDMEFELSDP